MLISILKVTYYLLPNVYYRECITEQNQTYSHMFEGNETKARKQSWQASGRVNLKQIPQYCEWSCAKTTTMSESLWNNFAVCGDSDMLKDWGQGCMFSACPCYKWNTGQDVQRCSCIVPLQIWTDDFHPSIHDTFFALLPLSKGHIIALVSANDIQDPPIWKCSTLNIYYHRDAFFSTNQDFWGNFGFRKQKNCSNFVAMLELYC